MSNWNKVNSEMYSLTDGPYHCIVRESGQMHYCEVFRNDDLILVSTVEGLQEAKDTCEVEILADLQKRGVFNVAEAAKEKFNSATQETYDALWMAQRYSNPRPILFDFKDTGDKEEILNSLSRQALRFKKRHAQAAKVVKDGCKAAAEQEPKRKFNWVFIAADYYCLLTDEFHVSVFTALDKWNLRIIERPSNIIVINSTLDKCEDAKKMAEAFLEGYYEGPEAKEAHKTKSPGPFAIIGGYELYTNSAKQKAVEEWSFSAVGISGEIISYRGFNTKEDAQYSSLEWVYSHVFGKSATIEFNSDKAVERKRPQPSPTEVEETVIAQIRKRRDVGREKYGTTMEREDLSFLEWLQHLQEELLDAAIYAEKLKRQHRKELLSDMIADDENSGLYEA